MKQLCIAMVGLPGRGKSTVCSKLAEGLEQEGLLVRIFNNGELRRRLLGKDSACPEFYDPANSEGRAQRENIMRMNLRAAREFFMDGGHVAILDATNVSRLRRALLESELVDYPILFVECINNDPDLLEAGIQRKTKLPEFDGLSLEEAVRSFRQRIEYYEQIYSPLSDERNLVKLDSLNNRILGERVHDVPYYSRIRDILVSDWVRSLFLARHGESFFNVENRIGGDSGLTKKGCAQAQALAQHFQDTEIPYIFTSPRCRSSQTVEPLRELKPETTVISLPEFDEINVGVCDSMRYSDIQRVMPREFLKRAQDKYHYIYPGGEGYATLKERVDHGLKKALFLSGNLPGILIVGHQAVNRTILSLFLFRRTEDVPYIYIPQNQYFRIVSTQREKLFKLVRFLPES